VAKNLSTRGPRRGAGGGVPYLSLGRQRLTTIRHDTKKRIFLTIHGKCEFPLVRGFPNQRGWGSMIAIANLLFGWVSLCPQIQGQRPMEDCFFEKDLHHRCVAICNRKTALA